MNDMSFLRGAFIAFDPGGYQGPADKKRVIPFRFNPESLARSLSVEQAQGGRGTEGVPNAGGGSGEQSADAASGTLKETFTVLVRLDFFDRHEVAADIDQTLGILPEVAALEDLLYPAESDTQANSDGGEPVQQRAPRPTVLFVWGTKRIIPVRITGLTINESLYNAKLNPTRAEIEVQLQVLSEADARDNRAVTDALAFTGRVRRQMARLFLSRTAAQNTNLLPL
jgi:hypothetical protein